MVLVSDWTEVGARKTAWVEPEPEVKHVEQVRLPNASRANGPAAETATVPEALGKVIVLSLAVGSVMAKIVSIVSSVAPSKVRGVVP